MNKQVFGSRKRVSGSLPKGKPNRHRVEDPKKHEGTSRSRPTQEEALKATPKGRKAYALRWARGLLGLEKINKLMQRAFDNETH